MSRAVDDYLAALPDDRRVCLDALRSLIARHLPDATECMSSAMPGFRHPSGKMVAGYAAFSRNLGLYPHSGGVIPQIDGASAGFRTSKSGILFTPAQPLPETLVLRILDLRLDEIAASLAKSAGGH
jgi:uncharacterized protein YdhG (YjbR/CyaY superfamily)